MFANSRGDSPGGFRPTVRLGDLSGSGGNALSILGTVCRQLQQQGISGTEIRVLFDKMKSGNYEHLLDVVRTECDWKDETQSGIGKWTDDNYGDD